MKVLLDTCISAQAAEIIRQAGHDVIWSGDWPRDPGDEEILRRAGTESRILATIDKDFGELVIVQPGQEFVNKVAARQASVEVDRIACNQHWRTATWSRENPIAAWSQ